MGIKWVEFTSAYFSFDDSGTKTYKPIGPISFALDHIAAFNDHMIRTVNTKTPVMETYDEIREKLQKG